ncbi:hypothetical protein [Acidovorax sp.]|uniref:hypothetical protein n=1 Tax=Acidovorax sp. TaxID=1872122 RepID=UPI0031DB74B7
MTYANKDAQVPLAYAMWQASCLSSLFCVSRFLSTRENEQGLVPLQALALAVIAQAAIKKIATHRELKQPAWP